MLMTVLRGLLLLLAGIALNMSLLHFFAFVETRNHPVIARSAMPHLASALWATVQLSVAAAILLGLNYRFAANLDTLFVFVGFCGWGLALGYLYDRHRSGSAEEARRPTSD
jgi:hypothetical protein